MVFIKCAGGKRQILGELIKHFPPGFKRYFEPFMGGGAVFFYIKQNFKKPCFISDNNKELINCYTQIRERVKEVTELLKKHKKTHNKEHYYKARHEYNQEKDQLRKAALFLYLNKTCFNGLYRVNSKGEFNVPIGSYKNPAILNEKALRQASKTLKGISIKTCDFEEGVKKTKKGDFIYLDPPYYPLKASSSFTTYTKENFGKKEHERLAKTFKKLDKKGCHVMLSNSDTEFVRELYSDYWPKIIKAKRMINSKGDQRGAINELVYTNY